MRPVIISTVLALMFVEGCAVTKVSSIKNPEIRKTYERIFVWVHLEDLELRKKGELTFVERLEYYGLKGFASHELIFPGKDYTSEELAQAVDSVQPNALLIVNLSNKGTSSSYISPTIVTTPKSDGGSVSNVYGGFDVEMPLANYKASLYDSKTQESMWVATMKSGGDMFTSGKEMLRSMAYSTVEKLTKDGIIKPTKMFRRRY